MTIFLIAEVTAVSILIKYISGTSLWITAFIIIFTSLIYTLYGGLRASIFTDNIQFTFFGLFVYSQCLRGDPLRFACATGHG